MRAMRTFIHTGLAGVISLVISGCTSHPASLHEIDREPFLAKPSTKSNPPLLKRFRSYDDAIVGMETWELYYALEGKPQAAFYTAHAETLRVLKRWSAQGRFHRPMMVERYAVTFANACRRAVHQSRNGEPLPVSWKAFFETQEDDQATVFTVLMLGINAHVHRDLPEVILAASIDPNDRKAWQDHQVILAALIEATPRIRSMVVTRYLKRSTWYYRTFGGWLDAYVARAFRQARNAEWLVALDLKSRKTRAERQKIIRKIESDSASASQRILHAKGNPLRQVEIFRTAVRK